MSTVAPGYSRPNPQNWMGKTVLITTDNWFTAPNGESYNSVFGTLVGIFNDKETLGIPTNAKSSNWYVQVGNMLIAGCQIHYAIQTNCVTNTAPILEIKHEGKIHFDRAALSRIYHADYELEEP